MRDSNQGKVNRFGRTESRGQDRRNARRNEKRVLLDIISYRRNLDNCNALYDEFSKYCDEPNRMLSKIQGKIKQILKTQPQAGFDSERGWLLVQRFSYYKYIPDRDPYCKVTKYDEIYYLAPDGRFVRYTYEFENGWNNSSKMGKWYVEKDWQQQDISLDEMTKVLDFHIYYRQMANFRKDGRDHEWLETSDIISNFSNYHWEGATVKAERLYAEKGVGLYRLLCAVLSGSEYYERTCAKINSRLDEIAKGKQACLDDKRARKDKWDEKVQRMEAMGDEKKPAGLLEKISSFFF